MKAGIVECIVNVKKMLIHSLILLILASCNFVIFSAENSQIEDPSFSIEPVSGPFIPRDPSELGYDPDLANVPPYVTNILRQKRGAEASVLQKRMKGMLQQEIDKAAALQKKNDVERQQVTDSGNPVIGVKSLPQPEKKEYKPKKEPAQETPRFEDLDIDMINALSEGFNARPLKKRITLHTKFASVHDVVEMISKLAGIDFMVDADVTGVTGRISCDNCTVGEILRYICATNRPQLVLIKTLNIWHIMRYEKGIRFIEVRRKRDFIFKTIHIYHAKFDDAFESRLKDLWSKITEGKKTVRTYITFDAYSRNVFVYGLHRHIREFERFIRHIDRAIPQVRIDMVLVLAKKSYIYNFGFNWSGVYNRQSTLRARGSRFGFAGMGASLSEFPTPDTGYDQYGNALKNTNLLVDPNNFALNLYVDPVANYIKIPFIFGGRDLNTKRLNLLLNAAEAEDKLKVLARPSVLTNNNETAEMLIGDNIPLQTIVEDTIQGATRNVTTTNFKETGTHIKVRPSVNMEQKTVSLDVFIQDNEIAGALGIQVTQTGTLNATETPPIIATLRTQNKVILRSGQTTVIGGLIRNSVARSKNEVPYLNKIPIIGWFFKAVEKTEIDEEQLIFITPTILE